MDDNLFNAKQVGWTYLRDVVPTIVKKPHPKALLIHPDENTCFSLSMQLTRLGFVVERASDTRTALAKYRFPRNHDVILIHHTVGADTAAFIAREIRTLDSLHLKSQLGFPIGPETSAVFGDEFQPKEPRRIVSAFSQPAEGLLFAAAAAALQPKTGVAAVLQETKKHLDNAERAGSQESTNEEEADQVAWESSSSSSSSSNNIDSENDQARRRSEASQASSHTSTGGEPCSKQRRDTTALGLAAGGESQNPVLVRGQYKIAFLNPALVSQSVIIALCDNPEQRHFLVNSFCVRSLIASPNSLMPAAAYIADQNLLKREKLLRKQKKGGLIGSSKSLSKRDVAPELAFLEAPAVDVVLRYPLQIHLTFFHETFTSEERIERLAQRPNHAAVIKTLSDVAKNRFSPELLHKYGLRGKDEGVFPGSAGLPPSVLAKIKQAEHDEAVMKDQVKEAEWETGQAYTLCGKMRQALDAQEDHTREVESEIEGYKERLVAAEAHATSVSKEARLFRLTVEGMLKQERAEIEAAREQLQRDIAAFEERKSAKRKKKGGKKKKKKCDEGAEKVDAAPQNGEESDEGEAQDATVAHLTFLADEAERLRKLVFSLQSDLHTASAEKQQLEVKLKRTKAQLMQGMKQLSMIKRGSGNQMLNIASLQGSMRKTLSGPLSPQSYHQSSTTPNRGNRDVGVSLAGGPVGLGALDPKLISSSQKESKVIHQEPPTNAPIPFLITPLQEAIKPVFQPQQPARPLLSPAQGTSPATSRPPSPTGAVAGLKAERHRRLSDRKEMALAGLDTVDGINKRIMTVLRAHKRYLKKNLFEKQLEKHEKVCLEAHDTLSHNYETDNILYFSGNLQQDTGTDWRRKDRVVQNTNSMLETIHGLQTKPVDPYDVDDTASSSSEEKEEQQSRPTSPGDTGDKAQTGKKLISKNPSPKLFVPNDPLESARLAADRAALLARRRFARTSRSRRQIVEKVFVPFKQFAVDTLQDQRNVFNELMVAIMRLGESVSTTSRFSARHPILKPTTDADSKSEVTPTKFPWGSSGVTSSPCRSLAQNDTAKTLEPEKRTNTNKQLHVGSEGISDDKKVRIIPAPPPGNVKASVLTDRLRFLIDIAQNLSVDAHERRVNAFLSKMTSGVDILDDVLTPMQTALATMHNLKQKLKQRGAGLEFLGPMMGTETTIVSESATQTDVVFELPQEWHVEEDIELSEETLAAMVGMELGSANVAAARK